ncbi:alpha/beta fold hydrolase [Sphingosinicella terrae]|uniref:alpha/beta fold hydrolase n=1 Tax=Sphingosinicella terrae TaxID=2172047 RepID=UPI000E0D2DB9|nr:alpha/beta hydrolase [Sphingosinicella terrae]
MTRIEPARSKSARASINGLDLYYEIHGSGGVPTVLLHGGMTVTYGLGPTLTALARKRQVIAPHMQGHGYTRDIPERPLSYEQMAEDVVALLTHLDIDRADLAGYSMGAGIAMNVAFRHPERVHKLGIVSTTMARDGWYPEVVQAFLDMAADPAAHAEGIRETPLPSMFPDSDWESLFRKMGETEREPFDWSDQVSAIAAPTMLIFADADAIRPEHIVDFYRQLGGFLRDGGIDGSGRPPGRLAILPGTTHYTLDETEDAGRCLADFFDAA